MWEDKKQSADDTPNESTDSFWTLPLVRTKSYRQPSFDGRTTDTIPVDADPTGIQPAEERIPPRKETETTARHVRPADRTPTYRTSVYSGDGYRQYSTDRQSGNERYGWETGERETDNTDFNDLPVKPKQKSGAGEILSEREGNGWLIRQITIRRWINDFSFYGRFAHDAEISHRKSGHPQDGLAAVPFFAYVPQYSQMNNKQLRFYLWFRDQTKTGIYPSVDMAYVVLYVFEVLNLPHLIPPSEGIEILCNLWVQYRQKYPRLDSYLCEWVPEYSMIHDVPLPDCISPILPDIVRKAQFKEFYLDFIREADQRDMEMLSSILLEAYSDYDYRKSRYYNTNKNIYDTEIRNALLHVLTDAWQKKRDIFTLDRIYRLTRDAYCGAIAQTDVKRRIDISFTSCIRSPETRKFVTDIVKYAENRLRLRLRIKSKLGTDGISATNKQLVDEYFGEEPPAAGKHGKNNTSEPDYLKQYEADSVGFDFTSAGTIEAVSWNNTGLLTEDNSFMTSVPGTQTEEFMNEDAEPHTLSGELSTDTADTLLGNIPSPDACVPATANPLPDAVPAVSETAEDLSLEKAAVQALIAGNFTAFCRERGIFPSRMADTVNEIFLDLIGDILIEDGGTGTDFHILDDYREDAETWSKT